MLRRKGYLKFYRKMRNVRRVPFAVVSIGENRGSCYEGGWCLQCLTVCLYIEQYNIPPPANAVMLLVVALLYFYHVQEHNVASSLYPVYFLYIIVGLELLFALPCLIYYIGEQWSEIVSAVVHAHVQTALLPFCFPAVRATMFNLAKQPPDVISDTLTGSESPTSSVTAVGFRYMCNGQTINTYNKLYIYIHVCNCILCASSR